MPIDYTTTDSGKLKDFTERYELDRDFAFAGIRLGSGMTKPMAPPQNRIEFVGCPYLSIVIPLTLLSAWLLLSYPSRANKTERCQESAA